MTRQRQSQSYSEQELFQVLSIASLTLNDILLNEIKFKVSEMHYVKLTK